jgi:hypothetical protein
MQTRTCFSFSCERFSSGREICLQKRSFEAQRISQVGEIFRQGKWNSCAFDAGMSAKNFHSVLKSIHASMACEMKKWEVFVARKIENSRE